MMAYFANATEGDFLFEQCFSDCPVGRDPDVGCPVLAVQHIYNYDQLDKGQEKLRACLSKLVDDKGKCLMREAMLQVNEETLSNEWAEWYEREIVGGGTTP